MRARKIVSILLVVLLSLSMFACKDKNQTATTETNSDATAQPAAAQEATAVPAQEDVTLRMWTFLDITNAKNARAVVLGKLIEDFEQANPGVTIVVEPQEWTTLSAKIFAAHTAGNAPDIFMVNNENLGQAIKVGCMEPLENMFLADWTDDEKQDVDSALWNAGYDGTNHYQVPLFAGTFGILYRSDLFEQKGIDPNFETWSDLIEAAKALTFKNTDGLQVYGLGIGYSTEVVDPYGYLTTTLFSQDGGMFTSDGKPNNWAGEAGQAALQMQIDMIDQYQVTPTSAVSLTSEEVYSNFEAGQYAMIFANSVRTPTVKGLTTFDPNFVKFMGYPAFEQGGKKSVTNAAGWCVGAWSGGAHKDIAGKFLEYLVSPAADEMWVKEATQLPIRKSTVSTISDYFNMPENNWAAVAAEVKNTSAWVVPAEYNVTRYTEDLQNAMLNAYVGGYSVEDALKKAEESFIARNIGR